MDSRLFVAFVTETWPPELNGVSLTAERAVRYLRGRGHRVELVRPRQAGDGPALRGRAAEEDGDEDGDLLVRGLPLPRYPGLQFGLPAPRLLLRRWREERPDVVHLVTEGPLGWSALFAARRLGIPVTSDFRTHFEKYSTFYRLGLLERPIEAALRAFHKRCDATFVATSALVLELQQKGFGKLVRVGRGVDGELFSPQRRSAELRARWGAAEDGLVVLHVGRLAPEKNPGLVIEAYSAIREQRPDARLVWVGDGPARASLPRRPRGQIFAGVQRGTALARHYASADLFLFPSLSDTFGNVVLEAMASGLPIVAFARGAAGEHLRDGIDARLVVPADRAAFVGAASELAQQSGLRRAFGAAAREVALGLSWPAILGGFEWQLLERVARPAVSERVARVA